MEKLKCMIIEGDNIYDEDLKRELGKCGGCIWVRFHFSFVPTCSSLCDVVLELMHLE